MSTARLSTRGQITIPRTIRERYGLLAHHKVLLIPKKESIELVPVKGNLLDLYGVFQAKKAKKVKNWSKRFDFLSIEQP